MFGASVACVCFMNAREPSRRPAKQEILTSSPLCVLQRMRLAGNPFDWLHAHSKGAACFTLAMSASASLLCLLFA